MINLNACALTRSAKVLAHSGGADAAAKKRAIPALFDPSAVLPGQTSARVTILRHEAHGLRLDEMKNLLSEAAETLSGFRAARSTTCAEAWQERAHG